MRAVHFGFHHAAKEKEMLGLSPAGAASHGVSLWQGMG